MTINNDNIFIIQIFKTMKDPGIYPHHCSLQYDVPMTNPLVGW